MDHILRSVRAKWGRSAPRSAWLTAAAAVSAVLALPHMWQVEPAVLPTDVVETVAAPLADAAATATAAMTGRHPGFDTNVYPGDHAMQAWKDEGGYEWVGYYLPAPCHKDPSWSGKRERLAAMGWGTAVIYVGQQTWGKTPLPGSKAAQKAARSGATCNAHFVSGDRGTVDGADAVARTATEGFPRGTIIFLDVERMEHVPPTMRQYYERWAAAVLADGRYRPGVYVHAHNAEMVHDDLRTVFADAGVPADPTVWVASGRNFTRGAAPTDVGHAFATMWQGMLDIVETHGGVRLPIDVNVSAVPSPSEPTANVSD
ncbi:MAG: DUF1906 domain-containing protein [Gemmatirosa sp.]|nr:DUF1906 domain-containing protein [Gemmatirosa sp.]